MSLGFAGCAQTGISSVMRESRATRLGLVAASCALLAVAVPSSALAGTVARSGSTLQYAADPGERNAVNVEPLAEDTVVVSDSGAPVRIDPASGCSEFDPTRPGAGARCALPTLLVVGLEDGDDTYLSEPALRVPQLVAGGTGNDQIESGGGADGIDGGTGADLLRGGPGDDIVQGAGDNDRLRGDAGDDRLDGGAGDDRIDALNGDGRDTVDCRGGGDDSIIKSDDDPLVGCGSTIAASVSITRGQRIRGFVERGLRFTVRCALPCAVSYELRPADRPTRLRVHRRDATIARGRFAKDGPFPVFQAAGPQVFRAVPFGRATRKGLANAEVLRMKLMVRVVGKNGLERQFERRVRIKR